MIKAFCDGCKLEISSADNNVSMLKSVEWKLLGKSGTQPLPKQEDFCGACTDKIKNTVTELKKKASSAG